jgi:cell shape-determining protein MreD
MEVIVVRWSLKVWRSHGIKILRIPITTADGRDETILPPRVRLRSPFHLLRVSFCFAPPLSKFHFRAAWVSTRTDFCDFNLVLHRLFTSKWLQTGFGLVIGFIDHLEIVNSLIHALVFSLQTYLIFSIFTGRFLVTDSNNVLCLGSYRLANISQLTLRLAAISHSPPTLLNDWTQLIKL